jgi:PilZ domain
MERRKAKRTKVVLPVKVSASGASQLAHTCDLTYTGARIGGLHAELKKGEIVSLQRGPKKADFKVVWVQQLGPNEIQVGLHAVQRQSNLFWGVDLPDQNREVKSDFEPATGAVSKKS